MVTILISCVRCLYPYRHRCAARRCALLPAGRRRRCRAQVLGAHCGLRMRRDETSGVGGTSDLDAQSVIRHRVGPREGNYYHVTLTLPHHRTTPHHDTPRCTTPHHTTPHHTTPHHATTERRRTNVVVLACRRLSITAWGPEKEYCTATRLLRFSLDWSSSRRTWNPIVVVLARKRLSMTALSPEKAPPQMKRILVVSWVEAGGLVPCFVFL